MQIIVRSPKSDRVNEAMLSSTCEGIVSYNLVLWVVSIVQDFELNRSNMSSCEEL